MNAFDGNYIVYQNRAHKWACIHRRSCSQVAKRGGVSRIYPPASWYGGPFLSVKHAQWYLDEYLSEWNHGTCSYCGTDKEVR